MSTTERWRTIPGLPDYMVSSLGRLASGKRWRGEDFRFLTPQPHSVSGYPYVQLRRPEGGKLTRSVHGLVALAFLGPRPEGMEVCHNDGDPANCQLSNLRYATHVENEQDKRKHGTHPGQQTHCVNGHEFDAANTHTDPKSGRRFCRPCTRVNSRNYRARKALRAAAVPNYVATAAGISWAESEVAA